MTALPFAPSAPLSLGVELELQLVRAHDFDLAHEAGDLIARLAKKQVPGAVKPESIGDLPNGAKRLHQRASGYDATIVAGEVTYRKGEPTGALPGRLVRGSRPRAAA